MPKRYPQEFKDDVIRVALEARSDGRSMADVARDFRIADSCLRKWLKSADAADGPVSLKHDEVVAENRELKRCLRHVEQERDILGRAGAYFAKDTLPK